MNELKKGMVFDCVFPVIYGINGGQLKQPCVIVQSFKYNSASATVVVCPIIPAAGISEEFGSVVFNYEDSDYAIIISNPITVQVSQLTTSLYRLDNSIVSEINKSLRLVFGIQPMQVIKSDSILQELQVVKQEIISAITEPSTVEQTFSSSLEACQEDSSVVESDYIVSEKESSFLKTSASSPQTESAPSAQVSVVPEADEELIALAKYLVGETVKPSDEIEEHSKEQKKPAPDTRIHWTDDKIDQFLTDCDTLSSHAIAEKWGMTVRTVSMNKSRLKKIRQKGKR